MLRLTTKRTRLLAAATLATVLAALLIIVSNPSKGAAETTAGSREPAPMAGYVAPSGSVMSEAAVRAIALLAAERSGEASPAEVTISEGSLSQVMALMEPQSASLPTAQSSGESAWLEAPTYRVRMTGSFELDYARVPPGEAIPTGSVLELAIDAHTGAIEGRRLTS